MRNYVTTVKIKGRFNNKKGDTWFSNLCSVRVVYNTKKDKIYILKVYKQKPKKTNGFIHPIFRKGFRKKLLEKAKWNYEKFILQNGKIREKRQINKKHHLEDSCERCLELGRYCK